MALSAMYHVKDAPPSIQLVSKLGCVKKLYAAVGLMFARFAYTIPKQPSILDRDAEFEDAHLSSLLECLSLV